MLMMKLSVFIKIDMEECENVSKEKDFMDIDRFITEVIPIRDSGLREELKRTCRIDVRVG